MTDRPAPHNGSDEEGSEEAYRRFRAFVSNVLAVPKEEVEALRKQEEAERKRERRNEADCS